MLKTDERRGLTLKVGVSAVVTALAWIAVLVVAGGFLTAAGAPLGQVTAYLTAWLLGCTFPGVMVWRALAGHSTLVKELGFGSVLGIVLQLIAWAVATGLHAPRLMILLPVTVVVVFLAVPGLRRHWWPQRTARQRTPVRWHLAMSVVIALAALRFYRTVMVSRVLPPEPSVVRRDTWFNTAVSYELSRTLNPQDPFAVGERLRYHWFADAHVTATAQLSGAPIITAMITLWLVPMLIVLLLVVAAAAQQFMDGPRTLGRDGTRLSDGRRWWVGPMAAFFTLVAPALWRFGNPGTARVSDGFVASSPSGVLAMVLIATMVGPILDLLRGRGRPGSWVILTALLVASVGTKPSILPVVAFGSLVVLVVDLFRDRRLNWPMAYVVGASVLIAAVASPILAGSTGGSHFQLLALTTVDPSYAKLMPGQTVVPAAGGWLVPALAERLPHAVPIIAMLMVVWILTETPRLLSLLGLISRPLRRDPGVLWACGVLGGGYGAMWVLAHPGYSEHYFWTVTVALGVVVTVTNAVRLIPASRRARTLIVPVAVVAIPGVVAAYLTTNSARVDLAGPTWSVIGGRLRPYGLILAGLAVALVLAGLLWLLARRRSLPLLTAVTAFALAAVLPVPFLQVRDARPPVTDPLPVVGRRYQYVSPEQQLAASWLREHSAPTDVVATNIFCWPMGKDKPNCVKNSMWLSGITGRRMVLSDWTYSSATSAAYDGTLDINRMPSPWPARRQLSTEAVEEPTTGVLRQLREQYGAVWIFADDRSTKISPRLSELATLTYQSDHIQIYRLRDSYGP